VIANLLTTVVIRRPNQDREVPHGTPPPTPPYVRITYTAVRQSGLAWRTLIEQRQTQLGEIPAG